MIKKIKLSPQITRSMIVPSILIAIAITSIFQYVLFYLGVVAFILSTLILVFVLGYKEITSVKNWIIQGIITTLIGIGILAFIQQDKYLLIMSIEIVGIIFSAIIQYTIYKNLKKK